MTLALWQLMHLGIRCNVTHCWYQWTKSALQIAGTNQSFSACWAFFVHWYKQCLIVHLVPKCMNYHKATVVITGRANCFHNIYVTPILLRQGLSTLCDVDHLWQLILRSLFCLLSTLGSLVPVIRTAHHAPKCISCIKSHCGDNRETILFPWLHIY